MVIPRATAFRVQDIDHTLAVWAHLGNGSGDAPTIESSKPCKGGSWVVEFPSRRLRALGETAFIKALTCLCGMFGSPLHPASSYNIQTSV